jgi:hypothetical protein
MRLSRFRHRMRLMVARLSPTVPAIRQPVQRWRRKPKTLSTKSL